MQEDENEKKVGGTLVTNRKTLSGKKLNLLSKCTDAITANGNAKAPLPNEIATTKMSFFSLYVEEELSQLDKCNRRKAEECTSDILFEIKLNRQQRNPYSGFNFGIPQQGQSGSYNIQGHS